MRKTWRAGSIQQRPWYSPLLTAFSSQGPKRSFWASLRGGTVSSGAARPAGGHIAAPLTPRCPTLPWLRDVRTGTPRDRAFIERRRLSWKSRGETKLKPSPVRGSGREAAGPQLRGAGIPLQRRASRSAAALGRRWGYPHYAARVEGRPETLPAGLSGPGPIVQRWGWKVQRALKFFLTLPGLGAR